MLTIRLVSRRQLKRSTEFGDWWTDTSDLPAQHSRLGNSWWAWILWVFVLEDSAYLIRYHSPYRKTSGSETMPLTLCVSAMLVGYALECALKARWLKKGNKLIEGGRYKKIPGAGDHDLVALASAIGFVPTPRERNVLMRLSKFAVFAGRYPVGKTPETMMLHEDTYLNKVDVGYFSKQDFRVAQSVLNKVISLVSGKKRRVIGPPGSASYRSAALEDSVGRRS